LECAVGAVDDHLQMTACSGALCQLDANRRVARVLLRCRPTRALSLSLNHTHTHTHTHTHCTIVGCLGLTWTPDRDHD